MWNISELTDLAHKISSIEVSQGIISHLNMIIYTYLLSVKISFVNGILKTSCSGFTSGALLNSTGVLPFISGIVVP